MFFKFTSQKAIEGGGGIFLGLIFISRCPELKKGGQDSLILTILT